MSSLCRDCLAVDAPDKAGRRCAQCGSPRLVRHDELFALSIAHLDCDAFYAAVEKRDNPQLRSKPLIIGGGRRGVVSTACYIARAYGVHSAQPMFKALKACPDAVVLKPNMEKYTSVGRQVRGLMMELTPLVEPLSLDEAFMDLTGTHRLHHGPPALLLARLQARIEAELGLTVSVGLSYCKFLAKVGSDLDKPRGFSVLGRAEAMDFLAPKPISLIWGVGKATAAGLARDGLHTIADLRGRTPKELVRRYGSVGLRLHELALGIDGRTIDPGGGRKSVSSEVTLNEDLSSYEDLAKILWRQCERVADRAKNADIAGETVILKLKTKEFRTVTRTCRLSRPTQLADTLYRAGTQMLRTQTDGRAFRLIGVGLSGLSKAEGADGIDLGDPGAATRAAAERAVDRVRAKFGKDAIGKGRGLR